MQWNEDLLLHANMEHEMRKAMLDKPFSLDHTFLA